MMKDQDSNTRTSDHACMALPEAGPEMAIELSERDWDALMEDLAHPSLPNAAMLRSIERWRQHMGSESNPVDVDKD